ncbi:sugar phosphate isomerase/epimerase [Xylanibacillus composti]|uniref:Sugar phosphate isomerase/epimerase n=1 Tax=Xylanibacillus composti TaxID=1572762 RepID=A0A8J4GZD0_9BACL|nr:sugar phosphate isomerase/epimerase family protein [Xylanibacillus composti]MDT9726196.1 sugar phosphate isomerase/epimerase [Xylanibacillus composti]GIQ68042.1 sugar phosphate isomerase/epimerase [Xylanibacillus composti]
MLEPQHMVMSGLSDEAGPTITQQIEAHQALGWQEMELRSVEGQALADWEEPLFQQVRSQLDSAGMRVTAVASRIANWERPITAPFKQDMEELKRVADRMLELGARYVRIMSYPNDGLPELEWRDRAVERLHHLTELAHAAGIVLLHENCSGWGGVSPDHTLYLLRELNTPAFRLLFDTGNGIAYKYDALAFLQQVWPYVEHVHIKDGRLLDGEAVYTLPGEGHASVRACVQWLIEHDYRGIWAIEPHLHLIPHLHKSGDGQAMGQAYVTYGRCLEQLLEDVRCSLKEGGAQVG